MADIKTPMTPAQRLKAAFEHRIPDEVPMFELEFYLAQEFFGREIITFCHDEKAFQQMSRLEQEKYIDDAADFYVKVYGTLDYAVFPVHTSWDIDSWEYRYFVKCIRDRIKDTRMLSFWWYGDGTFAIPDGDHMYDFAYRMYDDPEGMKAEAEQMCVKAIEFNHRKKEAGIDVLMLTSDYCYNSGPFMSPDMFAEYVTPYLARIIEAGRAMIWRTTQRTTKSSTAVLFRISVKYSPAIRYRTVIRSGDSGIFSSRTSFRRSSSR